MNFFKKMQAEFIFYTFASVTSSSTLCIVGAIPPPTALECDEEGWQEEEIIHLYKISH